MSLPIGKTDSAGTNDNNREIQITVEDLKKQLTELQNTITTLTTRITTLETWKSTGITNNSHFVCNNDTTYNGTNSKTQTITEGLVTAIEA